MKNRGQGIKKISNLFDIYKQKLIAPERSVLNAFLEVVHDLYGWDIPKNYISFNTQSKIISLKTSGTLVSEIKLNKKEILSHLKGRLGEKSAPKDII
jgi:hypothetical protein